MIFKNLLPLAFFAVDNKTLTSSPFLTSSSKPSDTTGKTEPLLPQFDTACVANPVILPPKSNDENDKWQCYYYGNAGEWNGGHKTFLPTGSSGLATSNDGGKTWTKLVGSEKDGSILAPSPVDDSNEWDSVQTGVGDVIRVTNDDGEEELHMYYFGGDDEGLSFGGPMKISGFRMRIGRAKSKDDGRTWKKDDSFLLDYDEKEGFFASWPRIVRFDDDEKPWVMFYHSFDGVKWRVFHAQSTDKGDSWVRKGLVIEGDESEGSFDFCGIGTRDVVHWKDGLLMIYEGVDEKSTHRLGAAFCKYDPESEVNEWTKLNGGKPILEPGKGPLGEWTKQVIGTPYVLSMPDGSLRLYHCGKDGPEGSMAIGAVVSESGEIEPECWTVLK